MKREVDAWAKQRLSWDDRFMLEAYVCASRSSCRKLHTGAVLVDVDKRVLASGYNGAPAGIENCLERGCRKEAHQVEFNDKGKGVCRGTHAEINAMNTLPRSDLKGTKMYSVYFPCSSCAKAIADAGVAEVIYDHVYEEADSLTQEMFLERGIRLRRYNLDLDKCVKALRIVGSQKTK